MTVFLKYLFIFFIGSIFGYFLELIYRRVVGGKWINPGFLMGPYLPIYGFGLCTMTLIYSEIASSFENPIWCILLMGVSMTVIELIGGLIFIRGFGIKLWDYSSNWLNFKGIICPLFSLIWTLIAAIYYFFVAGKVMIYLDWFSNHIEFCFVLGMFFSTIIIDFVYSSKILVRVKKYAHNNSIIVRYEELKRDIKDARIKMKERTSFMFPFSGNLINYLDNYRKKINKDLKKQKGTNIFKQIFKGNK